MVLLYLASAAKWLGPAGLRVFAACRALKEMRPSQTVRRALRLSQGDAVVQTALIEEDGSARFFIWWFAQTVAHELEGKRGHLLAFLLDVDMVFNNPSGNVRLDSTGTFHELEGGIVADLRTLRPPKIWKFASATLKLRFNITTKIRMPRTWEIEIGMSGQNLRMTVVRSERRTATSWEIHLNFENAVLELTGRPAVPAGPNHHCVLG